MSWKIWFAKWGWKILYGAVATAITMAIQAAQNLPVGERWAWLGPLILIILTQAGNAWNHLKPKQ